VKLYPEGATMTTATYNIQGLKTSVTDANNKIQFMEYDGLGRLRLIRDEERNILKTYEYNFKQ
jgi:YD repeat-containing protein